MKLEFRAEGFNISNHYNLCLLKATSNVADDPLVPMLAAKGAISNDGGANDRRRFGQLALKAERLHKENGKPLWAPHSFLLCCMRHSRTCCKGSCEDAAINRNREPLRAAASALPGHRSPQHHVERCLVL